MSSVFNFVTSLIKPVTELVDEVVTSKDEKNQFKLKLKQIEENQLNQAMDFHKNLLNQQATAIHGEISGNWLQRSWRPIVMLSFAFIVVYQFFISHLLRHWSNIPDFEIPDQFWTLLEIGIGGYVAGRSLEKIVPKMMQANADKKVAESKVQILSEEVKELETEDLPAQDMRKLARIKKREQRFIRGKNRRDKRRRERESG